MTARSSGLLNTTALIVACVVSIIFALAMLGLFGLRIWYIETHPTTISIENATNAAISEKASSLRAGEALYLSAHLQECARREQGDYAMPLDPEHRELYGWIGLAEPSQSLIEETASEIIHSCATRFVMEPEGLNEVQRRSRLVEKAGFALNPPNRRS